MRLMAAFWEGAQLRLQFEVDDGSEQLSRWDDVRRRTQQYLGQCGLNVWYDQHPAVDQYTATRETIAFSRRPRRSGVPGALRRVVRRRPIDDGETTRLIDMPPVYF